MTPAKVAWTVLALLVTTSLGCRGLFGIHDLPDDTASDAANADRGDSLQEPADGAGGPDQTVMSVLDGSGTDSGDGATDAMMGDAQGLAQGAFTSCTGDAQCGSPTPYCNTSTMTCQATAPLGHSCSTGVSCAAGTFCVNGVCCGVSSCPTCQACGSSGSCSAVQNGTSCAGTGTCSGGTCACPSGQLLCGSACSMSTPQCMSPFTEFPVPGAAANTLLDMTAGPDGSLWFCDYANGKIGRITTSGTVSEFSVGGNPQAITSGPDGNIWFTDSATNKIGTITTQGTGLVEYQGGGAFGPDQIIPGLPGTNSLWFTERGNNKVSRITTAGALNEYTPPTANAKPSGIAFGSDNAFWFTEEPVDKIGRVTSDGSSFTEYSLATNGNSPSFMTRGPDGNVWFTEFASSKLAYITTAGKITEIPLPSGIGPYELTTGSDNNMWFTELSSTKIGRRTSNNAVTEFTTPTANSAPAGIASGSDGNIWFTEWGAANIGRFRVCCTQ